MHRKLPLLMAAAAVAACFGGYAQACPGNPAGSKYTASSIARRAIPPSVATALRNPAPEAASSGPGLFQGIVGLWDTKFLNNDGSVEDEAWENFTSDGQELMIDTSPPAIDNVCNGVWKQTGLLTYKLKHVSWTFDLSGNLQGTAVFHTVITVNLAGTAFTGISEVFVYDLDGNQVFYEKGPIVASRVTVDF